LKGQRVTKKVTVIVEGCKYIVEVGDLEERPIKATINQRTYLVQVPAQAETANVVTDEIASAASKQDIDRLTITAPMPGDILEVKVKPGDAVHPGDIICVVEAMKMRNMIRTARNGVIASVEVVAGQAVDYGAILVTFE
jgi:biotin carboxyl carrier protein